jgi:hypothetical protein
MSAILDLTSRLRRKKQTECQHDGCEVDDTAASLTCANCGAEIDPWLFIRQQARHAERYAERLAAAEREIAAKYDEGNGKIAKQNETIMRLNAEIQQLTSLKNELWNTRVEGWQLGMVASRRRKRSP